MLESILAIMLVPIWWFCLAILGGLWVYSLSCLILRSYRKHNYVSAGILAVLIGSVLRCLVHERMGIIVHQIIWTIMGVVFWVLVSMLLYNKGRNIQRKHYWWGVATFPISVIALIFIGIVVAVFAI